MKTKATYPSLMRENVVSAYGAPVESFAYSYDAQSRLTSVSALAYTNGATTNIRYYWGKDLSGTLQGAGVVGGLIYLTVSTSNIEHRTDSRHPDALAEPESVPSAPRRRNPAGLFVVASRP